MSQLDLDFTPSQRLVVVCGDCLDVDLSGLGPFDAILSDPPYGLKFMGKAWDHGVPSAAVWSHLAQYLRPGAHVAAFGGTRTFHRLGVAIEDSGLEIRDSIWTWVYGSGWPKPANVSKYLDKKLGHERRAIGENPNARTSRSGTAHQSTGKQTTGSPITEPSSELAQAFEGWHANLKPAVEPLVLARKPLDGSLAENAIKHGLAGLNIDGCRIETEDNTERPAGATVGVFGARAAKGVGGGHTQGRWPSNMILTCACENEHDPGCPVRVLDEQSGQSKSSDRPRNNREHKSNALSGVVGPWTTRGHSDSGGASRFFYCAKVSRSERAGLKHPTMKPLKLTEYLARLLLPPPTRPRAILVPFGGVCSEALGALRAGWELVVAVEKSPEHCQEGADRVRAEGYPVELLTP